MSFKRKLITIVIMIFIFFISLDIFKEKFEGILLQYREAISKEEDDRIRNYNIINMPFDKRLHAFSYSQNIQRGEFIVGKNLKLEPGWYSFANKGADIVTLVINDTKYELQPDDQSDKITSVVAVYINKDDKITSSGELEVNKTNIFS